MPLPRWMIERLRESMGREDFIDLPHETAVGLTFRPPDSSHRGMYRLTRDALNSIRPEDPPRTARTQPAYVLKNGIYQA